MTESSLHEEPASWDNLEEYDDGNSIFRGHTCADWKLETSLERACKRLYGSLERAAHIENIVLREFRRRLHHYSQNIPRREDSLRWLSLLQHHGAPTRLLDWTYSIYIAMYFAAEHGSGQFAVWVVNKEWLKDEGKRTFEENKRSWHLFRGKGDEEVEEHFQIDVLDKDPLRAVIQVNPFQLDERLTIQKGVFLYPCDIGESFESNLRAMQGHHNPKNVRKLVFAHDDRKKALTKLHRMNITRATLFPGLDGFAQSLNVYHPLWDILDS
jgi:FRG domain-containing protein